MHAELPPLYLTGGVRALEIEALRREPRVRLMERAGLAAAELARELTGESGRNILVLAGPGNNGGDAFEAATHLKQRFTGAVAILPVIRRRSRPAPAPPWA